MNETASDLEALQAALDESYAQAGKHLSSIFTPARRLTAKEIVALLDGIFTLNVATVTAADTPLVAPVDGYLHRGQVWFGLPPGSIRANHLRARPQVSATATHGEEICLIIHGTANEIQPSSPEYPAYEQYCRKLYGPIYDLSAASYADREGTEYNARITPRRIFATRP